MINGFAVALIYLILTLLKPNSYIAIYPYYIGVHFILAYFTYFGSWALVVGLVFMSVGGGIAYIDVPDV